MIFDICGLNLIGNDESKCLMIENWSYNKLRNLGFQGEGYGCGFNDVIGIRSRSE